MYSIDRGYKIGHFRFADYICVEDDITVLLADDSTPVSKDNKFCFTCINCHFVGEKPVSDFLEFNIHKCTDFFQIFPLRKAGGEIRTKACDASFCFQTILIWRDQQRKGGFYYTAQCTFTTRTEGILYFCIEESAAQQQMRQDTCVECLAYPILSNKCSK